VNAGVSGYGTDQEYLLLGRIWEKIQPSVVVLIACMDKDRRDNGTNIRYDGYQKPCFSSAGDAGLVLRGQPVPMSRQWYIKQNWLVRHLWLARVVAFAHVEIRHPQLYVPDPTEQIVSKMSESVEALGEADGRSQSSDDRLVQLLQSRANSFRRSRWSRSPSPSLRCSLDAGRPRTGR